MKIIFIDRDGVINKDPGGWTAHNYVTDPKDLKFLPGSLEAMKKLTTHGFRVIIISNQAGVSKGYFTKDDLKRVDDAMLVQVKKAGGDIKESFYCIHKDEDNCGCRKPKSGLLMMAARKYQIDPKDTFFIGDSQGDIEAGFSAGAKTVLVLSGKTLPEDVKKWRDKPDYIFKDLLDAVGWLLGKEKRKSARAARREKEK